MQVPTQSESNDYKQRDATSLKILGSFFTVLAAQILLGTFWSLGDFRAVVVSLICGSVLMAVGIGMIAIGRKITKNQQEKISLDS